MEYLELNSTPSYASARQTLMPTTRQLIAGVHTLRWQGGLGIPYRDQGPKSGKAFQAESHAVRKLRKLPSCAKNATQTREGDNLGKQFEDKLLKNTCARESI